MRTWTLSDGRAGNLRQVQALAHALGLAVEHHWPLRPGLLARGLAPRLWLGVNGAFGPLFAQVLTAAPEPGVPAHKHATSESMLPDLTGHALTERDLTQPDLKQPDLTELDITKLDLTAPAATMPCITPPQLAIGCGRQAALATRLLRGRAVFTRGEMQREPSATGIQPPFDRCRVVQILNPRLDPRHWDIVLAPQHDALRGDNVISVLGSLNPVNDAWLAQGRTEFPEFGALPEPRIAVLIGGPTRHAPLQLEALLGALSGIAATARAAHGSVLLSGSPRTPQAWADSIRASIATLPGRVWFDPGNGRNPYCGLLAWADAIVCTADSVNMLSEACATRVPVFVIGPGRLRRRLQNFLDSLRERGRIVVLRDPSAVVAITAAAQPLRETQRVAAQIAQRLQLHVPDAQSSATAG